MLVNFREIFELAFLVSELNEALVINGYLVNEYTFGNFISGFYDT